MRAPSTEIDAIPASTYLGEYTTPVTLHCCSQQLMLRSINKTNSMLPLQRSLRFAIGAVGFAFVLTVASSDVSASCGDYLVVQGDGQTMAKHGETAAPTEDIQSTDLPTRSPCNGPQCQKRPSIPSTPVPQPSSASHSKQATAFAVANAMAGCPLVGTSAEQTAHACSGFPAEVLRPPRTTMLISLS